MSIKKSSKSSLKAPDSEILRLALLLARISTNLDYTGLRGLIFYCSAYLEDSEFQQVFRTARAFVATKGHNGISCDDWLVETLYAIYVSDAEKF